MHPTLSQNPPPSFNASRLCTLRLWPDKNKPVAPHLLSYKENVLFAGLNLDKT